MADTILRTYHVTVKHWRRYYEEAAHPLGGVTRTLRVEDLPDTREAVEVEIDLSGIAAQLGPKACRAKSRRSRAMGGLVVVRKVRPPKPPKGER